MAVLGANQIDIPEQFRPKADAGLRGLFSDSAFLKPDAQAEAAPEIETSDIAVEPLTTLEDDIETVGTPEGGMAFTPLAPIAGVKPTVVSSEPETPAAPETAQRPIEVVTKTLDDEPDDAAALSAQAGAKLTLHNQSLKAADGGGSSIILTGAGATIAEQHFREKEKEKQKNLDDAVKTAREALRREIEELDRQIAAMQQHIKELDIQFDKNLDRIAEIDAEDQSLGRFARAHKNEQPIARDADGKIKDKDAEKAVEAIEQKTGVKVDRSNTQAVLDAIEAYRRQQQAERDQLVIDNRNNRDDRNNTQTQIEKKTAERNKLADELAKGDKPGSNGSGHDADISEQIYQASSEQLSLENQTGAMTHDLTTSIDKLDEKHDLESEVSTLVKALYEAEKIQDPAEKMKAQKQAYDAASPDARDMAYASDEKIRYALEDDYYKPLDAQSNSTPTIAMAKMAP